MKIKQKKSRSKRETFLLALLLITAVAAICWHCYGSKLYSDIKNLKAGLNALETEIERFKNLHNEQTAIEGQWLETESLSKELLTALPSEEELPRVLEQLETTIALSRQQISSFKIGELYPGDKLSTIDISISATGPASRLERLLFELETFPHSLVLKNINWVNQEAGQATANVELRLLFYQKTALLDPETEIEVP